MSPQLFGLILIGGLLLLLALGVEIAVSMGVIASIALLFIVNKPQIEIPWAAWRYLNSYTLLAIPLFVFMGAIFANSGVVRSLFAGADKWFGNLPGGLATAVIGANAIFGAISGSSVAASATFAAIAFPEMEKRGYDPKLALGSIAMGGNLSVLIPPSVILIIYGAWEQQSVARLFAAALIPGIILAILLMATVMILATINPKLAPKMPAVSWRERLVAVKDLLPWLAMIIFVLGAIFGGLMTPTEAASLGAFLSIVLALSYRRYTYQVLEASFLTAVKVTAMIGFVMFTASLLAFTFQAAGLTKIFGSFVTGLPLGKYETFALICVLYLILGCFFDSASMMLLTMPFIMPVIIDLGFHPIWWGVVFVILAEVGQVTPPFGLILFAMQSVIPAYSILTVAFSTLPFMVAMFIILVLLTVFPQLALWLPSVLY